MTQTAEEHRIRQRHEYNALLEGCPARQLLEAISSKWVTLVLLSLAEGPQRHSELRRQIAGATQKMLTSTLRTLERDGLVDRAVTPTVPARTDYSLTPLGRSLLPLIESMKGWAEENMEAVAASRIASDRARMAGSSG